MFNSSGLLSQILCHFLNQGRTVNDILMRTAHWMTYFDLSKLNLAFKVIYWKRSNPNCNGNRRDKVALRTTSIIFKIIKIRTDCRYVAYFCHSENLNWAAQKSSPGSHEARGSGLDTADVTRRLHSFSNQSYAAAVSNTFLVKMSSVTLKTWMKSKLYCY